MQERRNSTPAAPALTPTKKTYAKGAIARGPMLMERHVAAALSVSCTNCVLIRRTLCQSQGTGVSPAPTRINFWRNKTLNILRLRRATISYSLFSCQLLFGGELYLKRYARETYIQTKAAPYWKRIINQRQHDYFLQLEASRCYQPVLDQFSICTSFACVKCCWSTASSVEESLIRINVRYSINWRTTALRCPRCWAHCLRGAQEWTWRGLWKITSIPR